MHIPFPTLKSHQDLIFTNEDIKAQQGFIFSVTLVNSRSGSRTGHLIPEPAHILNGVDPIKGPYASSTPEWKVRKTLLDIVHI